MINYLIYIKNIIIRYLQDNEINKDKGNYYKIGKDICKGFYKLDIYKRLKDQRQLSYS